jgi:hypothetical protein
MNKQEIDEMMSHLPSQQIPEETLFEKVGIAIMVLLVVFLLAWVPDFNLTEQECVQQKPKAYVGDLCEGVKKP